MKSPILGASYVARSVNAADNRMVNLFPEMVPEGGKEPAFLQRCPGLAPWGWVDNRVDPSPAEQIRGMIVTYDVVSTPFPYLYVVCDGFLYLTTSDAASWTNIGAIAGTGPVSIASSGFQLFIAGSAASYILEISTNTLTQITDTDFPGAVSVTYLNGRFVFCNGNDQKVWCTNLLDGLNIEGLNFASAEFSPDPVMSVVAIRGELWVFGQSTVEVWADIGGAGFPFGPIQGVNLNVGCMTRLCIVELDNTLFWLGQDPRGRCIVYRANGYQAHRISTHAVEWQIQSYIVGGPPFVVDGSEPYAYAYQQDGHLFYVITFPKNSGGVTGNTWVYDVATEVWHERAAYVDGEFVQHRGMYQVMFGDPATGESKKVLIADREKSYIYYYDPDTYSDYDPSAGDTTPQKWLRSWRALPTGANNLKRTAHHSLQLDCETGVQNPAEPVADPQVYLRWSDDGGHTWNTPRAVSMGASGAYSTHVIWRRLGMTMKLRDRVYEVSGTDPVKIAIMGAELILSPTDA